MASPAARDNPPLERTGPAVSFLVVESGAGAGLAVQRPYVMQQESTHLPTPLEYASPTLSTRPRRSWVLAGFALALVVLEGLQPRLTPPGWPTTFDYALMLLLPIGAVVMAICTSLPRWSLGLYGLFGSMVFLQGQFSDTRLHFRLETPTEIRSFLANWCAFIVGSWALCRSMVMLRRQRPAA